MLEIEKIKINHSLEEIVVDDLNLNISFSLRSDRGDTRLEKAIITCNKTTIETDRQTGVVLKLEDLSPFTEYEITVEVKDNHKDVAKKSTRFKTGRLDTKWDGKFISKAGYKCKKNTSPVPFTFRKTFDASKKIKRAFITAAAYGIFDLSLNGKRIQDQYFAPGFTSYKHDLQYITLEVTSDIKKTNELIAVVGPGWACGRFTYSSVSKITVDKPSLLLELFIEYEDGSKDRIVTDPSWDVTLDGNYRFGDFYDGEIYDATISLDEISWQKAEVQKYKFHPNITSQYGLKVVTNDPIKPTAVFKSKDEKEYIYDFSQNMAGILSLKINGKNGQIVKIRHGECLCDGNLSVKSLRTAKATLIYTCKEGIQMYSPVLTYMGFRYIGVSGIDPKDIEIVALPIYSSLHEIGSFSCSDERINRLQSNIKWSGRSNFVDIPTDCPQRDERMGWTGDIALFASTACYNFDMTRFLSKWLKDMRNEQGRGGGIPIIIPKQGSNVPVVAVACWSDSCVMVPYALYLESGDEKILEDNYLMMKKYLHAVKFWTHLSGFGRYKRNIWKLLYQYGDWCAPYGNIMDWMKKGKWIATAFYFNSVNLVSKIAGILNKTDDQKHYQDLAEEIKISFKKVLTDGNGKLTEEFQTGYALALYFDMLDEDDKKSFSFNLNKLVIENDYHLSTGFPGTPYLLFALADNGYIDTAYRLLLQDSCPSWLYCVKMGGTTTWEQWDAIKEDGTALINDEKRETGVSLNHYAYGAVGDFLYRRVLGIQAVEPGYKTFLVKPVISSKITYAKGSIDTEYGVISVYWKVVDDTLSIAISVPVSTRCKLVLPNGKEIDLSSGEYSFEEKIEKENIL